MKSKKLMKCLMMITILFMSISLMSETVAQPPSNYETEGAGTENNPFLISNLANLRWLSETKKYWGSPAFNNGHFLPYYFLQTANINASETKEWNEGGGFKSIGTPSMYGAASLETEFTGHYNGNGYMISDLYLDYKDRTVLGLFGVTYRSSIKNVRLVDINISMAIDTPFATYTIGTIVGHAEDSTITASSVTGKISIDNLIGEQV